MDINQIRQDRQKYYTWKNIAPLRKLLASLPQIESSYKLSNAIEIYTDKTTPKEIESIAKALMPWRKGPFKIFNTYIDSEWQSNIKYNLLKKHIDLKDKIVADIGCNNGYYMFRMLEFNPKKIVGFDPSPLYKTQFDFINHFVKSDITYEMLGIEHVEFYEDKFDVIFCLGVLYHRSDPISSLKSLKKSLNKNGVLYIDTFMIDGEDDIVLTPKERYSKIPNIYFVPTINGLKNWLFRAGFKSVEVLEITKTDQKEQRKTEWIEGESLVDFLDPNNPNLTVEGYPAPKRLYVKATI